MKWHCNIVVYDILVFAFGFFLDVFKAEGQIEILKNIGVEFFF